MSELGPSLLWEAGTTQASGLPLLASKAAMASASSSALADAPPQRLLSESEEPTQLLKAD